LKVNTLCLEECFVWFENMLCLEMPRSPYFTSPRREEVGEIRSIEPGEGEPAFVAIVAVQDTVGAPHPPRRSRGAATSPRQGEVIRVRGAFSTQIHALLGVMDRREIFV
jgi:hypothetical protein